MESEAQLKEEEEVSRGRVVAGGDRGLCALLTIRGLVNPHDYFGLQQVVDSTITGKQQPGSTALCTYHAFGFCVLIGGLLDALQPNRHMLFVQLTMLQMD